MDKNRKKIIMCIMSFFVMGAILSVLLYLINNSDFYKSRKVVDMRWMIGKTMEEINQRYSYPNESYDDFMGDHTPYVLCAREIYKWDLIEGMQGQYMYYALFDDDGKVVDVIRSNYGGYPPPYDYKDRW